VPWQLDHVQFAIPPSAESRCDEFYVPLLGFWILEKPPILAERGGRWYQRDDATLHLGVLGDFRAATKAHAAFLIDDYHTTLERLRGAGIKIRPDDSIAGTSRCYVEDPVGNRIELVDAAISR